mmetsp:Transcript_24230/g.35521  ORF Transcript_24230/g.35521 Transcript_24230/m.35521 type:complete len:92 (-) Transcript_24230:241-516(-)
MRCLFVNFAIGQPIEMWNPEQQHVQSLDEEVDEGAMNAALESCSGALMSHNTYKNIVSNKGNMDYCIEQFAYISNRIKCMKVMTGGGPFLA